MRRLVPAAFLGSLLVALLLALASHPLLAQGDSTVVDHTGVFGPILNKLWPVIITFLTSLVVKGASMANAGFAKAPEYVKWIALYVFALLFNYLAGWLGIGTLDPLAPMLGLSLVQTTAAAMVFKFGQHRVPAVA